MARDNGSPLLKQRVRHRVIAEHGPPAAVLELFAGEGNLYATCWREVRAGVTLDKDLGKVKRAAAERPGWVCIRADSEGAVLAGVGRRTPFGVVDIDAYGEPWPFLRAWLLSNRARSPVTVLVLTDGHMDKRNVFGQSKTLFPEGGRQQISDALYLETAQARTAGWAAEKKLAVESFRTFALPVRRQNEMLMRQHVVVVREPAGARWTPPSSDGLVEVEA